MEYNDRPGPGDASIVESLNSDANVVIASINGLTVSGGGDNPECVYEGIWLALALPWSPNSRRVMAVMGDAPAKVCDIGHTLADVLQAAYLVDIVIDPSPTVRAMLTENSSLSLRQPAESVTISLPVENFNPLYMIPTSSDASASFAALAKGSDGLVLDASDGNVAAAIIGAIRGGGGAIETEDLKISLVCPSRSAKPRVLLENPNPSAVSYAWKDLSNLQTGTGTASPGNNFLDLSEPSSDFITLTVTWERIGSEDDGSFVLQVPICS